MLPIDKRPAFIPPAPIPRTIPDPMRLLTGRTVTEQPFISELYVIRRDLMDADGARYIGPSTFEEDAHVLNCGTLGLRFIENRCKYVFQAKGCIHSIEWQIDRIKGTLSSQHTAVDTAGKEVDFKCEYRLAWRTTNTVRNQALQLPGYR